MRWSPTCGSMLSIESAWNSLSPSLSAPPHACSLFLLLLFCKRFYLFMRDTKREREAERQAEGEAGSMQGARCRTRSWVPRITPGPKAALNRWATWAALLVSWLNRENIQFKFVCLEILIHFGEGNNHEIFPFLKTSPGRFWIVDHQKDFSQEPMSYL